MIDLVNKQEAITLTQLYNNLIIMLRKITFLCSLLLMNLHPSFSQKQLIRNDTYKTWERLLDFDNDISSLITNDGKYFAYRVGYAGSSDSYYQIRTTNPGYELRIQAGQDAAFSEDSKFFVFKGVNDSLIVINLVSKNITKIPCVKSFKIGKDEKTSWIAYHLNNSDNDLVVENLQTKRKLIYPRVTTYLFNDKSDNLMVACKDGLVLRQLRFNRQDIISRDTGINRCSFDSSGKKVAFIVSESEKKICFYEAGMATAVTIIDTRTPGFDDSLEISSSHLKFTSDGSKIIFKLKKIHDKSPSTISESMGLVVLNWLDKMLPIYKTEHSKEVTVVSSIYDPTVIKITSDRLRAVSDAHALTTDGYFEMADEFHWGKKSVLFELISFKDGKRKTIKRLTRHSIVYPEFTPSQKFVVWFDNSDKQYYSYEIAGGKIRNLGKDISDPLYDNDIDVPIGRRDCFGIAGWLDTNTLCVYSRYDIWALDASGKRRPRNLTKGYGRNHNVIFRIVKNPSDDAKFTGSILLCGVNSKNKQNGFWILSLEKGGHLNKCTMGDYVYHYPPPSRNILISPSTDLPQKAKDADFWIVRRESSTQSPNLFLTKDFKSFKPLTAIHPESNYNWLRSELIEWKLPDGKISSGILYKPENFNPSGTYPVIFHIYEKLTDGLNIFPGRESSLGSGIGLAHATINIPWYVSNGYIVFVPDINYKRNKLRESIVTSIRDAVERLCEMPWVDPKRLGIQGFSFGAFETATVVAHTNLFAAAQATNGYYNSTSYYNYILGGIKGLANRNPYFELEQGNLDCAPWECPDLYIQNSPYFHVKTVATPLLLVGGIKDDNVPISQTLDFYASLRHLDKPAWLLIYDEAGHTIEETRLKLDFSIRQQQYFNHYLKFQTSPIWMRSGAKTNSLLTN